MTIVPQNNEPQQNEPKKIFGRNLRSKVVQMGLTNEQAAGILNDALKEQGMPPLDERTFLSYAYGERWPAVPVILTLVEVFHIDDIYLFCKKPAA